MAERVARYENLLSLDTWRASDPERWHRQCRRWRRIGKIGPLSWDCDLLNVHRPRLWLSLDDRTITLGFGWGDGSSDDVWRLGLELPLPRRWHLPELTDAAPDRTREDDV